MSVLYSGRTLGFVDSRCGWLLSYLITHRKSVFAAMIHGEGEQKHGAGGYLRGSRKLSKFSRDAVITSFFFL